MPDEDGVAMLKKQRTVMKTKLTKFINFLANNQTKITEIKMRVKDFEGVLDKFAEIQVKIDEATRETSTDYDEFENLYYNTMSKAQDIIEQNTPSTSAATHLRNVNELNNDSQGQNCNLRLPRIDLVTFDGAYDKWLNFYNNFKSMVHNNQKIATLDKLHYLRIALKGEAAAIVESLESSEENYTVAWDLLIKRYNDKRSIIQDHVKTLMELSSMSKESAVELRKLVDRIQTHLRALKSLGEPVDSWDTLLIYTITLKLDRRTHTEWEKEAKGSQTPKMSTFIDFLEERCRVLKSTTVSLNVSNNHIKSQNSNNKRHVLATTQKSQVCCLCKGPHKLYGCEVFLNMSVKDRCDKVRSLKACNNCLNTGHRSNECKWSGCRTCGKKHNTLLHYTVGSDQQVEQSTESDTKTGNASIKVHSAIVSTQVLLSTALIDIKDKYGNMVQARALLDSGSQSNFITKRLAGMLNLPLKTINLPVEGLNEIETRIKHSVRTEIYSKNSSYRENAEFLIIPTICNQLPNQIIDKRALTIPQNIKLADTKFFEPNKIDVLLGVEIFYDLLCIGQIEIPGHKARLHKTKLGWIISGAIGSNDKLIKPTNCLLSFNSLHKSIEKFWEIEEMENKTFLSEEEYQVEEHFKQTMKRDPITGRYIVRLPFNDKIEKLGESRKIAEKQFYSLERKLAKNPTLKTQYIENMREAIELGHMAEIKSHELQSKHCFLPHHAVIKESSSTTKVRIMYNASVKTSSGISLNDCLKVGAVVQNTSFDITLRFRTHQIIMLADIEKMYKQIRLDSRDKQYQLILWREDENDELKTFVIPVVLFGSASAPHSATRVLNQLADDEKTRFPTASKILKRDCYVDDVMTGTDEIKDAKKLHDELIQITASGGFTLRKWVSNHPDVIDDKSNELLDINLVIENNSEMKALGIQWNKVTDQITYKILDELDSKCTKRSVLSNIARLYDPIGLLGPVIVSAKILMQSLWQCNTGWDESLPHNIYTSWMNIKNQLSALNNIKFDRKTIIENSNCIEIHGFCDASEKAYGACIYIRSIDNNGQIMTNLLCSKNRIAPLKTISLPKLELCAALLLSRLIKLVLHAITKNIDKIYLWSDSSITLQWINTQPYLLKTFVANRVAEIREITNTMHWRHVSSQNNIADVLSRGQLPIDFIENYAWKIGPEWLRQDESNWPNNTMQPVPLCELKSTLTLIATIDKNSLLVKYSSISKLKRIVAYILRYKHNVNKTKFKLTGPLTVAELNTSLTVILKLTQRESFPNEMKQLINSKCVNTHSKLRNLNPFLSDDGLIRVGGRLKHSMLSYAERHPILLPKDHHITHLIIREQHITNLHSGTQATLNAIRSRYWPINGKNTIKTIIGKCVRCFRAKPIESAYFMGDLPRNRVISTRPFLNAGIDYCGPFFIKEKKHRNRGKIKVYACIFVCFATKAIHIELVTDLTTEAFVGCLRRFFARRGHSANIYSDNAKNFVGAKNEIEKLAKLIQSDEVFQYLANKGVTWHFSPPRSPHFGGLWEAAVKSFKHHFYRTIGDALFTYEELETYTTEIEAILNSRPITPLSNDPNDLQALTPAHFLIGDVFTTLPESNLLQESVGRLSNWQHIQYIKQHFWKRWYKEYLHQLTTRSKWQLPTSNHIKVGTMVLLKEDNMPPLHWPLGRIMETFPGDDGNIRVITVKTNSGTYKRCTTRVAPLPID